MPRINECNAGGGQPWSSSGDTLQQGAPECKGEDEPAIDSFEGVHHHRAADNCDSIGGQHGLTLRLTSANGNLSRLPLSASLLGHQHI